MNFMKFIKELDDNLEAHARFLKIKDSIPPGADARKYLSKKDRMILDRGMKRYFGFGLDGPPPFIPLDEWRKRRLSDASCTANSTVSGS